MTKLTSISIAKSTIPITLYDFFSHLVTGTIVTIYILFLFEINGYNWPDPLSQTFIKYQDIGLELVFLIIGSYLLGYIVSGFSLWFLQKRIVTRFLSTPMRNLFRSKSPRRELFSYYKHPYQKAVQKQIIDYYEQITQIKFNIPACFTFALHFVKENCPESYSRIQIFQIHSIFSRNLTFCFMLISLYSIIAFSQNTLGLHLIIFTITSIGGLIFFRRYLQFARLYANEIFMSFYTKIKTNEYQLKQHENSL